jgi:hypothetical protein
MKYLFFSVLLGLGVFASGEWEKEYDKDGVKIYTRNGAKGSAKEYKGVVEVNATVEKCVNQIRDVQKFKKMAYKTIKLELVEKRSENEWITYTVVDFPWPYDDRDLVSLYKLTPLSNGGVKASFHTIDGIKPETKEYARMRGLTGTWVFEPVSEKRTRVTHTSGASTEGFPTWLVNMFILDAPKFIMPEFRKQVE